MPQRPNELQEALDHPMAERNGVDAHQRPGLVEFDEGSRACVDNRSNLAAVSAEDQRVARHIDGNPIHLVALYIEAKFRSQLNRAGSAMRDGVFEAGDEHGPGRSLAPQGDARSDNFGRLA